MLHATWSERCAQNQNRTYSHHELLHRMQLRPVALKHQQTSAQEHKAQPGSRPGKELANLTEARSEHAAEYKETSVVGSPLQLNHQFVGQTLTPGRKQQVTQCAEVSVDQLQTHDHGHEARQNAKRPPQTPTHNRHNDQWEKKRYPYLPNQGVGDPVDGSVMPDNREVIEHDE